MKPSFCCIPFLFALAFGITPVCVSASEPSTPPQTAATPMTVEAQYAEYEKKVDLRERIGWLAAQWPSSGKVWKTKADEGQMHAQFFIGFSHFTGVGMARNPVAAREWITRSAEQGLPSAQNLLGYMNDFGVAGERDSVKAREWYQKAADQGYFPAINNLAASFRQAGDHAAAFKLFERAAQSGDSASRVNLALCYLKGEGCVADAVKARELAVLASQSKDINGTLLLAQMLEKGMGGPADVPRAIELYRMLAREWGNKKALSELERLEPRGDTAQPAGSHNKSTE